MTVLLPSISMNDIDPDLCYFNPGCAMSIEKPASVEKLLGLIRQSIASVKTHSVCCRHDPGLPAGATVINNCAGCDRRFRSMYPGIRTLSIWEVLDSNPGLPLPDHTGLTVSVQDPCSYRRKPQVHLAVRSLLHKMHINVVDSASSGTKSICCGDNFYPLLPVEQVNVLQKKRASQMPCSDVVVYCVSCAKSMAIGGKIPHHMADLVLDERTEPGETRLDIYHADLDRYIQEH